MWHNGPEILIDMMVGKKLNHSSDIAMKVQKKKKMQNSSKGKREAILFIASKQLDLSLEQITLHNATFSSKSLRLPAEIYFCQKAAFLVLFLYWKSDDVQQFQHRTWQLSFLTSNYRIDRLASQDAGLP